MLSIAIVDKSTQQKKDQGFINLVSTPLYKQLAGQYVEFLADDAPPIDTAYLDNPYQNTNYAQNIGVNMVNAIVTPAYAFSFMDVGSKIWDVINWIIPFEDVGILGQQIYYLATGNDKFDPVELALSTLGTLSIIPLPPTKALKVVVGTLRKGLGFMKRTNPKFLKAFASVIGRIGQRAFKPVEKYIKANRWKPWNISANGIFKHINIDPFIEAAPFIIIIGELLGSEEGRTALITLIKSIESDDDLFAWINYLSLPADGWDSSTPPVAKVAYNPPVDELNWANSIAKNTLGVLVPEAHASVRQAGLRVSAEILTKTMRTLKSVPKKARIASIKKIHKAFDGINSRSYTKLAHTTQMAMFATVKGVSANTIKQIYRKRNKLRISPVIIIGTIAYLESRRYCDENGKDVAGLTCKAHADVIIDNSKLGKLYASALTDILLDEEKFNAIFRRENGNMFHIAVLALKHLIYEQTGDEDLKVVDIEHKIQPEIYLSEKAPEKKKRFWHEADIIIGEAYKKGSNGIAIELKSYKSTSLKVGTTKWKTGSGGSTHKQFYLDRVAKKDDGIKNFEWWFQSFVKSKPKYSGPTNKEMRDIVRPRLAELPIPDKAAKRTLGLIESKAGALAAQKIQLFNVKNAIKAEASTFLQGIASDTIVELIDGLN